MLPRRPSDAALREKIKEATRRDLLAADLKCSLFVSALQSYKRDSVLRPFPGLYANEESKDFDALLADTNALPSLKELPESISDTDKRTWDLFSWILSSKFLTIQSTKKKETSLFGEGTYLTSDLSLALLYSPHGLGWQRSVLGPVLSCVAVCEIIDHPDVKCQVKKKDSEEIDRKRARVKNSEGGDVPQKYFVVTNNQLLRVKYLLVYSQKQHRRPSSQSSWFSNHRFAIMMMMYLLLLIVIGASNSPAFLYYWNRMFDSEG
ncbi:protein mono-ADP-ribosyltransferase PARP16 isoform X2 [Gopherus evgoodei]|uniref:protein mono-ADP-ribosyltransferase PARP16 isoform X2 n=1 Tax=Gopherus evgoodei TaxID=1825980 RepID=UPI0011CF272D|nr:protein mono-ADP-ribosyltransferase PARP16 isoform X2 [Gopherus evgoodei]